MPESAPAMRYVRSPLLVIVGRASAVAPPLGLHDSPGCLRKDQSRGQASYTGRLSHSSHMRHTTHTGQALAAEDRSPSLFPPCIPTTRVDTTGAHTSATAASNTSRHHYKQFARRAACSVGLPCYYAFCRTISGNIWDAVFLRNGRTLWRLIPLNKMRATTRPKIGLMRRGD